MRDNHERPHTVLLAAEGVSKTFGGAHPLRSTSRQPVAAVSDVTLHLQAGESLGLVGESGSGKSTLARMLLRLCEPTSGRILFRGNDVTKTKQRRLLPLRRQAQIVLQDAGSALDPRMTVAEILDEPFTIHALSTGEARMQRLRELLAVVELPEDVLKRFPHQLSGGQQQRLCIARALALNPTILVCDEAFSGLDVPLKAQMANLLVDLRERLGLTYLFVSHELSWVRYLTDRVAVMFQGRIVEVGPTRSVFGGPLHPYTRGMLAAEPRVLAKSPVALPVLSPTATSTLSTEGCGYAPRCDRVIPRCHAMQPQLVKAGDIEVACHHYTS